MYDILMAYFGIDEQDIWRSIAFYSYKLLGYRLKTLES